MNKFFKIISAAVLLFALVGRGFAQPIPLASHLYHTPVFQAHAQQDLAIRVDLEEGVSQVISAQVLWRSVEGEFRSADLEPVNGGLAYTIPAADVQPPQLEYCLLLRFSDGQQISFPVSDPQLTPQKVVVIREEIPAVQGPQYVILYPSLGEGLTESEFKIAVSIFDPDSTFDPLSLEIFLDGRKIRPEEFSGTFALIKISSPPPGAHEIVLRSRDFTGQVHPDFTWPFKTATKTLKKTSPWSKVSWSFTGEEALEDFGGVSDNVTRGDLRVRGEVKSWNYAARTYLTSDEAGDRQPQNRFQLELSNRWLKLNVGDTSPRLSDLVLSGKRVRGVELGVKLGNYHLDGVYGDITRGIESSSYRRWLLAFSPYYERPSGTHIGLTFLKAKDDLGSVTGAASSPHDNVVAGLDLVLPFWQRQAQVSFSSAFSLTAQDIRGGAISQDLLDSNDIEVPLDPQAVENLIVINESLSPPNPLGLSSLAWVASLKMNHFGQFASLNYRSIGPAYQSLGNPYLQNDLAGWNFTDQFSIWKRKLFVNLGFSQLHDNLKNNKEATTTTTGVWVTFTLYPTAPAPQILLSLNYTLGKNDLNSIDSIAVNDTLQLYSDLRRDEDTKTLAVALIQNLFLLDRRHTVALNLNRSDYQDRYTDRPPGYTQLNTTTNNLGLSWRTEINRLYSATLEYTYYANKSDLSPFSYHQMGALFGGKTRLFNSHMGTGQIRPALLNYSVAAKRRQGDSDLNRWQTDLSADCEFYPKHSARFLATGYFYDAGDTEGLIRLYYIKRF